MDRDKIIAIVLVIAFVFLFVALLGVVTVTGFLLFFTGDQQAGDADAVPLIESDDGNSGGTESPIGGGTSDDGQQDTTPEAPPAPVCGNGKKETGEQCESNSQCTSSQVCNTSCQCEAKPPERAELTTIAVTGLRFWCAPDFGGKRGLAINKIDFKNNGSTDFSYRGNATITAVTGNTTDAVTTKNAFKFEIKAGKTLSIYNTNILRDDAPYIFLGSTPDIVKITIDLGNQYIEYSYTLRGNDFGQAGCL